MSQQAMPFFDSDKAATKYAIQASGKTMKDVGRALWPNKGSIERAQTDLLNALNDGRAEQLSSDEHAFIANYTRQYEWVYYTCLKTSHERPRLVTPGEQAAALQEQLFNTAAQLRSLLDQVDALRPKLRAVGS